MIYLKAVVWGVLVLIVIQWLVQEKLLRARKRLPPGPTSLPIIGNLHNLSKKPHKSLAELAKIHGPLMLLRLGFLNVVVVSSPEVAREVLQKKEVHFSDRSVPDCIRTRHIVDNSIAMMPVCNRWRTTRRIANTLDLFLAGTETTSNTIEWAMAELLHEPTKLRTTQNELQRVVGRRKFIKEADFAHLPYLQAVVKETFRLHPPGPLLIPRKANSDTDVYGFKIPKDSKVLVNIWAIGRDSNIWSNPNEFEPERFLNSEVDVKGNHFELIPFGSGRRICAGIPLATRMLPLMLGNLVNFFDWELPNGMQPQDMEMDDKFGMVLKKATPLLVIPTNANI